MNTSSKNVKSSSGLQGETARKTSSGNQQGETRNVTISGKSVAKSNSDQRRETVGTNNEQKVSQRSEEVAGGGQDVIHEEAPQDEDEPIDEANVGLDVKSDTTHIEPLTNPVNEKYDTTNTLAPFKTTKKMVRSLIYPENYTGTGKFTYTKPNAEKLYGKE